MYMYVYVHMNIKRACLSFAGCRTRGGRSGGSRTSVPCSSRNASPAPTSSVHPAPYTLHPTPYTLHPTPYTLHPTPYNLHPAPQIQPPNPKP